jgi:hypothetical protein
MRRSALPPDCWRQPLAIFVSESVRGQVQAKPHGARRAARSQARLANQFDCAPPPP